MLGSRLSACGQGFGVPSARVRRAPAASKIVRTTSRIRSIVLASSRNSGYVGGSEHGSSRISRESTRAASTARSAISSGWIVVHRLSLAIVEQLRHASAAARSGRAGGPAPRARAAGGASGCSRRPVARPGVLEGALARRASGSRPGRDDREPAAVRARVVLVVDVYGTSIHRPPTASTRSTKPFRFTTIAPSSGTPTSSWIAPVSRPEAARLAARELASDGPARRRTARSASPGSGRS